MIDRLEQLEAAFIEVNKLKPVLVNSVPKSGTTWMRTMVSMLPNHEEYPREGVSGLEPRQLLAVSPGQVFHGHLLHSSELEDTLRSRSFRTVYVYRDLRDIVVSDYFHRVGLNPKRAPDLFKTLSKEELFRPKHLYEWCGSATRYKDIKNWLNREFPTVRYEDLQSGITSELQRIFTDMGYTIDRELTDSIASRASFKRQSGRTPGEEDMKSPLRKGIVGDWRNHFTRELLDEFLDEFGELLELYGYDTEVSPGFE